MYDIGKLWTDPVHKDDCSQNLGERTREHGAGQFGFKPLRRSLIKLTFPYLVVISKSQGAGMSLRKGVQRSHLTCSQIALRPTGQKETSG